MSEAGLSIALATGGKLIPFVDVLMLMKKQLLLLIIMKLTADGAAADLDASAPDGYITYGGGVILNLLGKVSGYVSINETTNREDYSETTISGSLKLKF